MCTFLIGIQVYTALLTAYDFTGVQAVHVSEQMSYGGLTEQDIVSYLMGVDKFGKLRKDHGLAQVPKLGTDIFAGAKWAFRMQSHLCPGGRRGQPRPGYVLHRGVCVDLSSSYHSSVESVFEMIEVALQGLPQQFDFTDREIDNERRYFGMEPQVIYTTLFNPLALVFNPVEDLKTMAPNKFNKCGNILELKDPTLGGTFPNGDVASVIEAYGYAWIKYSPYGPMSHSVLREQEECRW